jgi:integrase
MEEELVYPDVQGTILATRLAAPSLVLEVALSTVTIEALESFRQGEIERRKLTEPPRTGLIWCRPDGGHLNYRTEANILGRLLKAAGIESRTPHELRHTAATLMFSDGASVIQVQHQLRHSRPSITLDHYGHLLPKDLRPVFSVVPNAVLTPEAARLTGTDG